MSRFSISVGTIMIALGCIWFFHSDGPAPESSQASEMLGTSSTEQKQRTIETPSPDAADFISVIEQANNDDKDNFMESEPNTSEEVVNLDTYRTNGSLTSQRLGALYETDKETYLELMASHFESGLDDIQTIARNNEIIGNHMKVALADIDMESVVACSKTVCYIDVIAPKTSDSVMFGLAFLQGWTDVDEFVQIYTAERLDEERYRFFFAREDIDLDSSD